MPVLLVILDRLQICYLNGQNVGLPVSAVMVAEMVVYTEHISNHLRNHLSKEFVGPHLRAT